MVRVGNVPTVSAYKGNLGQQMMRVGKTLEGISQDYERKGEIELAQAKKLYTQGLNINLYNSINELRNNPNLSANPQGLASAMDEVLNKTLQDVDDNDVKMAVMVDYQLKKNTYVNHAQAEFDRVQRAKAKSYAYDSVYANIDSLGTSFANALTGNYTDDDIANFQHSLANIQGNIDAKNPNGTYIFTDTQRRAMKKDAQEAFLNGYKAIYEQLDDEQKKAVAKSIDDDSFELVRISPKGKDEQPKSIKLKDVVGENGYKDIKKYTTEQRKKDVKARLEERKLLGDEALADFYDNPTEEGLEKVIEYKELSQNKIDNLREILEKSPNYQAVTTYDGVKDATKAMNEFMGKTFESDEEEMNAFIDMMDKMGRTQEAGIVSAEDNNVFVSKATNALRDKELKKLYKNYIPSINETMDWNAKQLSSLENRVYVHENGMPRKKSNEVAGFSGFGNYSDTVKEIMRSGLEAQLGYIAMGDIESAEKVRKDTKRQIIEYIHPEVKGKNVGDTLVINGKVYKITSKDDNVVLGSN